MSPEDIRRMKEQTIDQVADLDAEVMLVCFAVALHEDYGWGRVRVLRALTTVDDIFGKLVRHEVTLAELKQKIRDDMGIIISV